MIICFECLAGTKKTLDDLVSAGGYEDYGDVIAAAVANQALLHEKVGVRRSLVIPNSSESAKPNVTQTPSSELVAAPGVARTDASSSSGRSESRLLVPDVFALNGLSESGPQPADLPDDAWVFGQEVPISRWLFGQYNKLLPAKASCRALARLLTSAPDGLSLSVVAVQIAEAASHLGDYLAELDRISGVSRDEALATAFPKTGEGGDKSRLRFASQFVAWTNGQGQLSGLLMGLKLINRTGHKEPRVKLTDAGWKFGLLRNPVLDVDRSRRASKLSEEECTLLLEHIATSVPVEDFAYQAVLKGIEQGAKTPESLDDYLVRTVPKSSEELTKEFVATQRSGVVSRMIDLGMIARVREGVRVSYALSDRARAYLIRRSRK